MNKRQFVRLKKAMKQLCSIQEEKLSWFLRSRGVVNRPFERPLTEEEIEEAQEKFQELDARAKSLAKAIKLQFFPEEDDLYEQAKKIFCAK